MKLLVDDNISYKIIKGISSIFPESKHISDVRLSAASDLEIWSYARINDFTILTFDSDFIDLATLRGTPPKIILLKTGNLPTSQLTSVLINSGDLIAGFLNSDQAFLELNNGLL